ncbi:hypothetical protein L3V59_25715 [Burkholderia aenigmatica]|uniref:hypothetical protein n=1 Tax=Burkholderia aenigmatica TaxID=2015348 RepID=UPI001F489BB4|nr:hypothetical protein [Burkholderia aenigmatica]UKD16305.1 hypothetical protein L3V59_25715 [Burkholderia aenigmatica]
MIVAKTYLKIKEGFVDFCDFNGGIPDPEYVEGAVELSINGVEILTKAMWDCVDQLWAYLAEGVICVARGDDFKTYFPDQPIEISFSVRSGKVIIAVIVHETVKVVVDQSEFVSGMKRLAVEFFEGLRSRGGAFEGSSNFYLSRLDSI